MRIISNGIDFDLPTGFAAELSRYNVLLSDAGEQTAPITLPGTPKNLRLVGYSDRMDNVYKPLTDLDVTVIDGLFHRQCNLGIHTANAVDGISCTIYLGTGEFYSKVGNTRLNWLGWPVWKSPSFDTQTLAQNVQYLINILKAEYNTATTTSIFGIRPVVTTQEYTWIMNVKLPNGSAPDKEVPGLLVLNGFEKNQVELDLNGSEYIERFEGEFNQRMLINEATVPITLGYGMTPFLKLRYVLEFILGEFGYTFDMSDLSDLSPNFRDKTLLINNVADAIYSGILNIKQLVPDVTIKEFLIEIEKYYNGKFVFDYTTKISKFILYQNQLTASADIDLSGYLTSTPKMGSSEFETVKITNTTSAKEEIETKEKVSTIAFELLGTVSVADNYRTNKDSFSSPLILSMIPIGEIVHLNTSVVIAGKTVEENTKASSLIKLFNIGDEWDMRSVSVANAGYVNVYYRDAIQLFLYEFRNEFDEVVPPFTAINLFYAAYKAFKLNSNIPIEAEMNIPASELERMDLHVPKILHGQPVMIESIKYALGKKGTQAVTLRTLRKYEER
jgi:hypothetical protein